MMHYDALADGAGYFKKSKEGRKIMCEAVEKYGDERERRGQKTGSTSANISAVRNLMRKMKLTLEQALDTLEIQGEERNAVLRKLLK